MNLVVTSLLTQSAEDRQAAARERESEMAVQLARLELNRIQLIVNGLLAAVTALTFGAVLWQAIASSAAARADKASAHALDYMNRAEIDLKNWEAIHQIRGAPHLRGEERIVRFKFDIKNVGKTSARIDEIFICIQPETTPGESPDPKLEGVLV